MIYDSRCAPCNVCKVYGTAINKRSQQEIKGEIKIWVE